MLFLNITYKSNGTRAVNNIAVFDYNFFILSKETQIFKLLTFQWVYHHLPDGLTQQRAQ